MKKFILQHQFFSSIPILFFIIFLHPIYLVRLFEKNQITLDFFKTITGIVVLVGFWGAATYLVEFAELVRQKNLKTPKIWLLLPLNVASLIITIQFLLLTVLFY